MQATKDASDSSQQVGAGKGSSRALEAQAVLPKRPWRRLPTSPSTAASSWPPSHPGTQPSSLSLRSRRTSPFLPRRSQSPAWPTAGQEASRVRRFGRRAAGESVAARAGVRVADERVASAQRCIRAGASRRGSRRAGAGRGRRGTRTCLRPGSAPAVRSAWSSESQSSSEQQRCRSRQQSGCEASARTGSLLGVRETHTRVVCSERPSERVAPVLVSTGSRKHTASESSSQAFAGQGERGRKRSRSVAGSDRSRSTQTGGPLKDLHNSILQPTDP